MTNHIISKEGPILGTMVKPRFPGGSPLPEGFRNGVKGWHIRGAKEPGLRTMDVEHVPEELVGKHNDPESRESLIDLYHPSLCIHRCPSCFSEERDVYGKSNRMLTLAETFGVVDQAIAIAKSEGHAFESVKFLGPGELLMNPELFEIIEGYARRGVILSIFTKGALLGHDGLAKKYQGRNGVQSAFGLANRLASCGNVNLLMSFQSFDPMVAQRLVSTTIGSATLGLKHYAAIRDKAFLNLQTSGFYSPDGTTDRICMVNAPIVPENMMESFDIYRFFIERGTPVVMTPTMISGKGLCQLANQAGQMDAKYFVERMVELYSDIYAYNIAKGMQTIGQVQAEGISSYVGAEPCNQVAHGIYICANGDAQMCVGRRDAQTRYGNVHDTPLAELFAKSPHGQLDPVNNRCPAKDSCNAGQDAERVFHFGFYDRVMSMLMQKLGR